MKKFTLITMGLLLVSSTNSIFAEDQISIEQQRRREYLDGITEIQRKITQLKSRSLYVIENNKWILNKAKGSTTRNPVSRLPIPKPKKKRNKREVKPPMTSRPKSYKEINNKNIKVGNSKSINKLNTPGKTVILRPRVVITDKMQSKVEIASRFYFDKTGRKLVITSGQRTPYRQANAMLGRIDKIGIKRVRHLYKNKKAVDQVIGAYKLHARNRSAAVDAMSRTIEKQVANGVYISRHLREGAIDVSRNTNPTALKAAVRQANGTYFFEVDHYHLNLNPNG